MLLSGGVFVVLVLYLTAGSTWLEVASTAFVATVMLLLAGLMRLYALWQAATEASLQPVPVLAASEPDVEIVDDFWTQGWPQDED